MRIDFYSYCAWFIKIPFREVFRNPLLSLPGTFRDSVFLANSYHFGGESDKESTQGEVRAPGPLLTKHDFFHFPFRIPFRPASGQPGDDFLKIMPAPLTQTPGSSALFPELVLSSLSLYLTLLFSSPLHLVSLRLCTELFLEQNT